MKISLILLAGGRSTRMGLSMPKPFLPLKGKPLILHSFDLFRAMEEISEIVVVCPQEFHSIFPPGTLFASPGAERQLSVQSGFQKTTGDYLLIHDGARPLISKADVQKLLQEGIPIGAATLATPAKYTIKEVCTKKKVKKTLDRSTLYEIHTPQLLRREIYEKGYKEAKGAILTDDVALAEVAGYPVKIVEGCSKNLKVTTPIDLKLAEIL